MCCSQASAAICPPHNSSSPSTFRTQCCLARRLQPQAVHAELMPSHWPSQKVHSPRPASCCCQVTTAYPLFGHSHLHTCKLPFIHVPSLHPAAAARSPLHTHSLGTTTCTPGVAASGALHLQAAIHPCLQPACCCCCGCQVTTAYQTLGHDHLLTCKLPYIHVYSRHAAAAARSPLHLYPQAHISCAFISVTTRGHRLLNPVAARLIVLPPDSSL